MRVMSFSTELRRRLARTAVAAVTVTALVGLAACSGSATDGAKKETPTKITFSLDYSYDGLHAPFFVAQSKGYYEDAGLDVTLRAGAGSSDTIQKVSSGVADGGVASATSVLTSASNNTDLGVLATGLLLPHTPSAVVSLKSRKITEMKDLEGRSVTQSPAASVGLFGAMLKDAGVDASKVKMVNLNPSVVKQTLMAGKVDASAIYVQVFADVLDQLNVMMTKDYGIDPYSSAIIFGSKFANANPAAVSAFMKASMRGLKDTIADPEVAGKAVAKVSGTGEEYYIAEIKLLNSLWDDEGIRSTGYGLMTAAGWEQTQRDNITYIDQKAPLSEGDLAALWTNKFLGVK